MGVLGAWLSFICRHNTDINASWIKGSKDEKDVYIAAQVRGVPALFALPLLDTFGWRHQ